MREGAADALSALIVMPPWHAHQDTVRTRLRSVGCGKRMRVCVHCVRDGMRLKLELFQTIHGFECRYTIT